MIADSGNDVIRFVPASTGTYFGQAMAAGDIYTIAGDGACGCDGGDGGPATSAELDNPTGGEIGPAGNLAIADSGNNVIRFVPATSGTYFGRSMTADDIYTIAGDGTAGYSGSGVSATSAELDGPTGVAIDTAGGIVVADASNNVIRYVANTTGTYFGRSMIAGDIYTIAGDGTSGYSATETPPRAQSSPTLRPSPSTGPATSSSPIRTTAPFASSRRARAPTTARP